MVSAVTVHKCVFDEVPVMQAQALALVGHTAGVTSAGKARVRTLCPRDAAQRLSSVCPT